jgi:N-acetylglucosamine-6-sulfatase
LIVACGCALGDNTRMSRNISIPRTIAQAVAALTVFAAATHVLVNAELASAHVDAGRQQRPNVILIITDDQDVETVAYMPRLSHLIAKEGTTFTNMFVSSPQCCPAHVSYLTGRYPHNTGVLNNWHPTGGFERFREIGGERSTIATWVQAAGYRTARFGKYLTEYEATTYVPPGWSEWYAYFGSGKYFDYTLNENGRQIQYGANAADYSTDVLTRKVLDFIDRVAGTSPFFVVFAPAAPHGDNVPNGPAMPAPRHRGMFAGNMPLRPPSFNEADVSDKPEAISSLPLLTTAQIAAIDQEYRTRLESLQSVDEAIQQIIERLAARRILDDTYVIFTSDNGYHLGQHRLRNGKTQVYEEDIRVPLIIRGPGVPVGAVLEHFIMNIDFAPTIAELAGIRPGHVVDGQSFVEVLDDHPPRPHVWRRDLLLEVYRRLPPLGNGDAVRALRTYDGELYAEYESGPIELYDLRRDPYQLESQHERASTGYLGRLSHRLAELARCAGDTCR